MCVQVFQDRGGAGDGVGLHALSLRSEVVASGVGVVVGEMESAGVQYTGRLCAHCDLLTPITP